MTWSLWSRSCLCITERACRIKGCSDGCQVMLQQLAEEHVVLGGELALVHDTNDHGAAVIE
jgi:hypothetical protein